MLNFVVFFLFSVAAVSPCGVGEYSNGGQCKNCDAGTYQDLTNHQTTSCKECPVGFSSGSSQASECDNCDSGQYASNSGSTTCDDCALGQYQEEDSQASCKTCPQGFAQISTTECGICFSSILTFFSILLIFRYVGQEGSRGMQNNDESTGWCGRCLQVREICRIRVVMRCGVLCHFQYRQYDENTMKIR